MKENFNLEKPKMDGTLPKENAHDLANMMRAKMGVKETSSGVMKVKNGDPLGDYGMYEFKKIKPEDYEEALKSIEELEKLANEESGGEEVGHKVFRILQNANQLLFGTLIGIGISFVSLNKGREIDHLLQSLKDDRVKLYDAKKELKELKKSGDKFGKEELKR